MSNCIDISIINRDELLEALWLHSKPAAFFAGHSMNPPEFNLEKAKASLDYSSYADYICGRAIKSNIYESNTVDPWGYDRHNGQGAFQTVVNSLL